MSRKPALAVLAAVVVAGCATPESVTPSATLEEAAVPEGAASVFHPLVANGTVRLATGVAPLALEIGHDAGEPTLGITPDGTIFYAALTFDNLCTPEVGTRRPCVPRTDILRSVDGGSTWEDVTPAFPGGAVKMHPDTGDPYVYVDPVTGRVFDIDQRLLVTCHTVTYSDDLGETWSPDAATCVGSVTADHHTIVAAKRRTASPDLGYANVVVVCWNAAPSTTCSRSFDGGRTFVPAGRPFHADGPVPFTCGLNGHLKAAPDGTLYISQECDGAVRVAASTDDAATWTSSDVGSYVVPDSGDPEYDPALAVDSSGTVYCVYEDSDGRLWLVWSSDQGSTWVEPIEILPSTLTVGHLPALAAGGPGRVVVAYMGSDTPEGYETSEADEDEEIWHGYLEIIEGILDGVPVATTTRIDPEDDPLVHGACGPSFRCPGAVDFLDVVVDADGRPWAAFVDACSAECAAEVGSKNDQSLGLVATFATRPSLLANGTMLPPVHGATR